jgi:hypothetical protein
MVLSRPACAQAHDNAMSDAEADEIRSYAMDPYMRVATFHKFMQKRMEEIRKIAGERHPLDRDERLHDLMDQFASLADELDDNLDEYEARHDDIRKPLHSLDDAAPQWAETLDKLPPDNAYDVVRKIALEAATDLRDTTARLIQSQDAWFAAHPPNKKKPDPNAPYVIPR